MSTPLVLAEAYPAGEFLAEELEAREWSQAEFAQILDRPEQFVSEIISGKKLITRESAAQIGAALGTSAELWLNLQNAHELWKQGRDPQMQGKLAEVRRRARLHELVPVKLFTRRGYISSGELDTQEHEILSLLGLKSLDETPSFKVAARRSNLHEEASMTQRAWVACVRKAARSISVSSFEKSTLESLAHRVSGMVTNPADFAGLQSEYAKAGVKLVYVESFPGGKLDGCALVADGTPIIGLSGRGRRLDKVLFTLLHETAHVLLGHVSKADAVIVDDLDSTGDTSESQADDLASSLAIPGTVPSPPVRWTSAWITQHAAKLGVHPIVLVGRYQRLGLLGWNSRLAAKPPQVVEYLEKWESGLPSPRA